MRKAAAILSFLFIVAFTPFVDAQSTQAMGLDEVIQDAAKRVEEAMAQGVMIAVLNFTSPSETFSDYVESVNKVKNQAFQERRGRQD